MDEESILRPIVISHWDRSFVANSSFRSWLLAQLAVDPIASEPLVTYVSRRVAHAQATNGSLPGAATTVNDTMAPASTATPTGPAAGSISPSMTQQPPATVAPASFFAQPVASTSQPRIRHPVQAPLPAATVRPPSAKAPPLLDWTQALPQIRELLSAESLSATPARAAHRLSKLLKPFEAAGETTPVPFVGRLEIVELIVKRAGASTWSELAAEKSLRAIFEAWLQTAAKQAKGKSGSADETRREAVMPLLTIFDTMPLTSDDLRLQTSLPRLIAKIAAAATLPPDIRTKAKQLEDKWRLSLRGNAPVAAAGASTPSASSSTPATAPAAAVSRTSAASGSSVGAVAPRAASPQDVKKRPAAKDAKASEPAKRRKVETPPPQPPKPSIKAAAMFNSTTPLPSFSKKARTTAPGSASAPLVVEAELNGFQQALFAMQGGPPPASVASTSSAPRAGTPAAKPVKRVKTVRWAPDDVLVAIREIESRTAVDADNLLDVGDVQTLDQQEGRTWHDAHITPIDEEIDWEEPLPLALPDLQVPDYPLADSLSGDLPRSDLELQREREEMGEEAVYADQNDAPETPREPSDTAQHAAEAERAGAVTRKMQLGATVDADPAVQFYLAALREAETGAPVQLTDPAALSGWLAHLAQPVASAAAAPPVAPPVHLPAGFDFGNVLAAMQPLSQAQAVPDMTGLLSQLSGIAPSPQANFASGLGDQSMAFQQATGFAQMPSSAGPSRRGSRHNGNANTPCKFYRKGDCFLGKACSYKHD